VSTPRYGAGTKKYIVLHKTAIFNTLWTGDADMRLYITTVQDG